ncbi:carbohydrate binding domain-containing protein [Heyndrickxia coagulans]|uniref:carbohydrate binding domain-containing protein n=1 Tax=Heyndrickxia coagulans TaxID=1398 RepID=UPI002E1AF8D5|nr:carbohydrate binding domain-containing protein [Heyndrickxia coagulans]MED4962967.1 hypothetical protein [Heyndrickxia coagulans]
MALLGSVDIPFTKSTQIANGAQQTATQAADTAGQAQTTAQTASQTATQAANTAENAAQAAQIAITTANGKNKAYYGAATPTSPQSGDIWFVEDSSGNVTAIKHYDGAQWVTDVDNAELAQQISAAQAAADNAAAVGQEAQQAANTAQQAATQAKTDAANAVTQANNAVDKANDAAANAQSAIDKAQEGFDAAQDALSKAGNATDIANTAKQVASDAATAADTAKANAQTALTNAQDAIDKANAANANANTREKSIVKSNTAPSNPEKDQLWVDTSKTPQIMRRWNGTAWVDLSPTQASQIGAVSTTTYTTDITNINNTLSQKASATTVNTLTGRVDKAETAISQNANAIASKADKSYVDTLKNTVDSHSTLISQNADAIALKASQSTVDALTGRVSTAEATLKTQADQIAARITKTDADAKYATQASLTATANSLTSNISAVQTNLDNLQVGGRNLVPNSTGLLLNSDGKTAQSWQEGTISHANNDGTNSLEVQNSRTSETTRAGTAFSVEPNTTYIFRARIKGSTNSTTMDVYFLGSKTTKTGIGGSFDYVHLLATGTTNKDNFQEYITTFTTSSDEVCGYIRIDNNASSDGNISSVYFSQIKLEKGNKATDWTPAPEDMATVAQFNTLSQTLDSTVSRIGNAEGSISALQQTANSFATRISNAEGNISTLTQTAQGLQTAVSGKVDTTTYNSFVAQTNSALQSKLSATDADRKYATQSQLTQTASSLQSTITTAVNNIQVGGTNLCPNSTADLGMTGWTSTINDAQNLTKVSDGHNGHSGIKFTANSINGGIYTPSSNITGGKKYTVSFWVKSNHTGTVSQLLKFKDVNGNETNPINSDVAVNTTPDGKWYKYEFTFTAPSYAVKVAATPRVTGGYVPADIVISQYKLEEGNKATDWTPAPEDMATQSQISQLSNNINLRVSKNDVINQINLSTESILIGGNKVHITGQTTIDNAVIKDAMIASMTANKLTAGTIDANAITVKNINASNITTGTLNAARIAAGSIDASKLSVSSLSAISANLGTVTAGTLSGVQINGSNFYQSANNIQTWLDGNGFHQQYNGGQLDTWINSDGINVFNWGNLKFGIDNNGNVVANNIKLNGDMALNGTFNIPTTLTGRDGGAGLHGRYQYTESLSSYNPKILDGDWFLNSSFLGFRTKATVQTTNTTYFGTSYYGATAMKLRAYVNSSNGQYDGDYTNLNNRVDIMPSQITMGQYQPSGSSNWPDEIKIRADGTIYASKSIQSGNVYFNGANSIKNDSSILYLEGNGGIQSNNILINGAHSIKSLDGGEIYLNNSGTGYVDLTVKTLHQASRWELKENFETMDPEIALKNIINTDVVRYNFKGESEIHVGLVIDDRDNPEYRACSDFITPDRKSKKDETIVGELMLATKALNAYTNDHKERLSVLEEQNKNLILKVANLEMELANIKQKLGVA